MGDSEVSVSASAPTDDDTAELSFLKADAALVEKLVSRVLQRIITLNDIKAVDPQHIVELNGHTEAQTVTRFHARSKPSISVPDYVARIIRFAAVDPTVVLCIPIYVDRVCRNDPHFVLSSYTVHRFIIAAVTCAAKIFGDTYLTNSMYSKIGGVTVKELNKLELEFLSKIDWRLVVDASLIQAYYDAYLEYSNAVDNQGSQ